MQAIGADNSYAPAYNSLGHLRLESGNLDEAESFFRQAIQHSPNFAPALHNLSIVEYRRGDYLKAQEWNNKALIARPGFQVALDQKTKIDSALHKAQKTVAPE